MQSLEENEEENVTDEDEHDNSPLVYNEDSPNYQGLIKSIDLIAK